ncbi:hypothetical protein QBC38DRAFT_247751 [Podospora fimiseda]|uniref:Uncharacterized protein n=1 Tax=Podospora fimiseda TaxID=252190 RepID=A0AAN7BXD5_9PEZI|nr:hypothetical protein QBC38DRAFT_247751 [Podospora fimiseda]
MTLEKRRCGSHHHPFAADGPSGWLRDCTCTYTYLWLATSDLIADNAGVQKTLGSPLLKHVVWQTPSHFPPHPTPNPNTWVTSAITTCRFSCDLGAKRCIIRPNRLLGFFQDGRHGRLEGDRLEEEATFIRQLVKYMQPRVGCLTAPCYSDRLGFQHLFIILFFSSFSLFTSHPCITYYIFFSLHFCRFLFTIFCLFSSVFLGVILAFSVGG